MNTRWLVVGMLAGAAMFSASAWAQDEVTVSDVSAVPVLTEPGEQPAAPTGGGLGGDAPILTGDARKISFQALLTDGAGIPLAGPVNLRFTFYDALVGGSAVYGPVDVAGVALVNGVASVQVPVDPNAFNGSGRWLGVRVNLGVELSPRIPLTAVPYALRVDRVTSEELDNTVTLGDATAAPLASAACASLSTTVGAFMVQGEPAYARVLDVSGSGLDIYSIRPVFEGVILTAPPAATVWVPGPRPTVRVF